MFIVFVHTLGLFFLSFIFFSSVSSSKLSPVLSILGDFIETRIFPDKSKIQRRIQELPNKSLVTIFDLFCNIADQPTYALTQKVKHQLQEIQDVFEKTLEVEIYPLIQKEIKMLRSLSPDEIGAVEQNMRVFIRMLNKLVKTVDSDILINFTTEIGNLLLKIGSQLDSYSASFKITDFIISFRKLKNWNVLFISKTIWFKMCYIICRPSQSTKFYRWHQSPSSKSFQQMKIKVLQNFCMDSIPVF